MTNCRSPHAPVVAASADLVALRGVVVACYEASSRSSSRMMLTSRRLRISAMMLSRSGCSICRLLMSACLVLVISALRILLRRRDIVTL